MEASLNRSLRAYQDEAFLESLRADQEKERRREDERRVAREEQERLEEQAMQEEQRRMSIAQEKINFAAKVPSEPAINHPDAVDVVFKLPDGQRLSRRFLKSHSLEVFIIFMNNSK